MLSSTSVLFQFATLADQAYRIERIDSIGENWVLAQSIIGDGSSYLFTESLPNPLNLSTFYRVVLQIP